MITRRQLVLSSTALVALGALGALGTIDALRSQAAAQTFSVLELEAKGPLDDIPLGSPTAPVTVIEYASMTCPHCAAFENTVFPKLKEKYIDTGNVRFIMREYPLDRRFRVRRGSKVNSTAIKHERQRRIVGDRPIVGEHMGNGSRAFECDGHGFTDAPRNLRISSTKRPNR